MSKIKFFEILAALDKLMAKGPNVADVTGRALELIQDDLGATQYFFDRLESAEWIEPLWQLGLFDSPPQPERDDARGTIGFPVWPASRYLARMASLKPDVVLNIILEMRDTDNSRVLDDMVDAALNMPPSVSVHLLEKAKAWARAGHLRFRPEKVAALVTHFLKGGYTDAGLDLARDLLEILPDPRAKAVSDDEKAYRLPPEPIARFSEWDYKRMLKKDFPSLLEAAGIQAFELICDQLESAVRLSRTRPDDAGPEDYSYIWRPAVEDHTQNLSTGIKNILVSAVRDAALRLLQRDGAVVSQVVRELERRPWKIFHRIALHVLRLLSDAALALAADRLTDKSLFDDSNMRHEYSLLIQTFFPKLTEGQQGVILGWIEHGPDLEKFRKTQEEWMGKPPTDEEVESYRKGWQVIRLAWFKDALPENWKKRYQTLVAECGEPQHPDFASPRTSWVGPTSPKGEEQLKALTVTEIVQFLKDWIPPEGHFVSSPEGLGRNLSSVVSGDPSRFADQALLFVDLDPTYVRALLFGLREALKQGRSFAWPSVLELCQWVVSQPPEIPGRISDGPTDIDPDWGWTRKAIASIFSEGFDEEKTGIIPTDHREAVWSVLHDLTDDPDPTPETEASYAGTNMDPVTLSINTTRGEAMHAVVRYALWVRRHIATSTDAKDRLDKGFDELSEVRDVLNSHLDVTRDPSVAVRAVYGEWFPWLNLLDPAWAKQQVPSIFPEDVSLQALYDAAWEAYIVFCQPYDEVFLTLKEQYAHAVARLGSTTHKDRLARDPEERLSEHLMTLYWRGKIVLDEPEGILPQFWAKADSLLRGHALEFIGRSLRNQHEEIPSAILERMKALWERRLEVAQSSAAPQHHKEEMAAFGSWFVSGKFPDEWALPELLTALRISGKTEPDDDVVERLGQLVDANPNEVVACLDLMVKGDRDGWHIYGWRDQAKMILAKALPTDAADAARDLVHYLGSRGYIEFRDLLK